MYIGAARVTRASASFRLVFSRAESSGMAARFVATSLVSRGTEQSFARSKKYPVCI